MKLHKATRLSLPNVAVVDDVTCSPPPVMAEKVIKTMRYLIQNGKSKMMQDMQKRGKSIGKALNNAVVRHHEALTCRPRDAEMYFVSPLEYQFSCNGSPPRLIDSSRSRRSRLLSPASEHGRKVMRICRGDDEVLVGRRVKVAVAEKEFQVDEAAEEFIERFYRDLRLQKWLDHCC